jgi:hypothetical protein
MAIAHCTPTGCNDFQRGQNVASVALRGRSIALTLASSTVQFLLMIYQCYLLRSTVLKLNIVMHEPLQYIENNPVDHAPISYICQPPERIYKSLYLLTCSNRIAYISHHDSTARIEGLYTIQFFDRLAISY